MGAWRFNLRSSNTEPLLRLNVEARGDAALVVEKVSEIRALIEG
jgi:phosphomannomutase